VDSTVTGSGESGWSGDTLASSEATGFFPIVEVSGGSIGSAFSSCVYEDATIFGTLGGSSVSDDPVTSGEAPGVPSIPGSGGNTLSVKPVLPCGELRDFTAVRRETVTVLCSP
jgi:hypothetical protein